MTAKRSANSREIFVFSRGELDRPRRSGYALLPRKCFRADCGRTITQYTAQLAAHYHSLNCRNILQGKQPGLNPAPIMIIDHNWSAHNRTIKISIAIFEGGYGYFQIGKGMVKSFVIPIHAMPNAEWDTWDYEQEIILFFRRMLRQGQI